MKQVKFWELLTAVCALMLASCADDAIPGAGGKQGGIRPFVDLNTDVVSSRQSRAQAASIDANELRLTLVTTDGQKSYDLGTLGEFDANKKFPVGNYILHAEYGDANAQGFDTPHYKGQSDPVRIVEGETVDIGLSAQLANTMFTVTYTDALKKYLTAYSAELMTAGNSPIEYAADETRAAYVKPGKVDVYVNVTKPSGTSARLLAATVTAEARHHYYVTIDINDGEVGEGQLVISFDDSLETEDVEIDLSDELLNAPAPEVTASADVPIDYVETTTNKTAAKYNIIARGYLSQLKLETANAAAIGAKWPESIELMATDAETQASLKVLGLNALGVWNNPDRMAVVDLTDVISNIADNGQGVTFTLTAIDKMGKASDPVEIAVNVIPLQFEITEVGDLLIGTTSFDFTLKYNGDDPQASIQYYYKNNRGTYTQCVPTAVVDNGDGTYTVTMPTPDAEGDFTFYATNGKVTTDQVDVPRIASRTYAVEVADAYATRAYIKAYETVGADAGKLYGDYATLYLSTDGNDYQTADITVGADGMIAVAGLQPNTTYYARVSLNGKLDGTPEAVTFTTEQALQLPNGDLESWTDEAGTTDYWSLSIPGSPWGTLNELTTSQPGTNGYAWNATSGTKPAEGRNGGTAAYIATVGWGSGNTAATTSWFQTVLHCDNVTVGELYLGSYDAEAKAGAYGYEFASRPSSLTFWYKYTRKASGDRGVAIVKVLDADGNVIAEAEKTDINAASAFTECTLDLDYGDSTAKAASVQVVFRSSNGSYNTVNTTNLNYPARNTTDYTSRYYGSELYIDDITFNY